MVARNALKLMGGHGSPLPLLAQQMPPACPGESHVFRYNAVCRSKERNDPPGKPGAFGYKRDALYVAKSVKLPRASRGHRRHLAEVEKSLIHTARSIALLAVGKVTIKAHGAHPNNPKQ